MKEFHATITMKDCTSVDAETPEEARNIALEIFLENHDLLGVDYEIEVEENGAGDAKQDTNQNFEGEKQ